VHVRRIGLFGGTFDPPHFGHVAALEAAAATGLFDLIEVTVAGDPYVKSAENDVRSADVRLAMAKAAFDDLDLVQVSDLEIVRTGPSYTIDTVRELLKGADDVDLIVDGGPCRVGVESTIVDLTGEVPAILRAGAIGPTALADALGTAVVTRTGNGSVRAPGMLAAHYAPRARLVLSSAATLDEDVAALSAAGERVAKLALPVDPSSAARTLYASLRALDAEGNAAIVVALPPDEEPYAAIRDRLIRAAAPRS